MKDNCILLTLPAPAVPALEPALVENFGSDRAVTVYTEMAKQVFALARRQPDADVVICYWRDSRHPDLRWLDADDPGFLVPRDQTFIESFIKSVRWCFEAGAKRVVCVSAQSPGMADEWIAKAFEMLAERDLVLGPTRDGGWYLLGFNGIKADMFKDYPWTGENKGVMIGKRAKSAGQTIYTLPEFYSVIDVDTLEEWLAKTDTVLKHNGAAVNTKKDFPAKPSGSPGPDIPPAA
ncbi:MAG: DUF2064 domain-containing protein [Elusimicrobiaceae bacterium]|nr:DUF2064 domain-containing protein [Elusimicrobiaceae bacterium]